MDFSSIKELYIPEGKVKSITFPDGSTLIFRDYSAEYLTIESLEDNNEIGWKMSSSVAPSCTIEYSTDKVNWNSATADTTGVTLATLNNGDLLYLRGNNLTYDTYTTSHNYNYFTSTKTFNTSGNIMSLINKSSYSTLNTFGNNTGIFYGLFINSKVVDASHLILPVTSLVSNCYSEMFMGCTSLTSAPALPATRCATYCYSEMFRNCTSLTSAPALPSIILSNYCYDSMFQGCTSLTSVPVNLLQAGTVQQGSYRSMFKECTNLTNVTNLPGTYLRYRAYNSMYQGCISLTSIPTNLFSSVATIEGNDSMRDMFSGCTSLTNAANMPNILSLPNYSCTGMYYNCTSLVTVPSILPATTLGQYCYQNMFYNCPFTTAPELPATTLPNRAYYQMFRNCSNLNYIKMLATDISGTDCLYYWTNGVAASGTFVKNAFSDLPYGTSGIPNNWTVQDAN